MRGGKDTEHYFCARNITNSYFKKKRKSILDVSG